MFGLLKLTLIGGLVACNAFFVASEYALLSVRRTRLEQLANEGHSGAKLVLTLLTDMVTLFAGTQLGITVVSVLMGWMGEGILANALEPWLAGYLGRWGRVAVAHSLAAGAAFVVITMLLMVLGELVPKALAYQGAERFALGVARPLYLFLKLSRYPVRVLDLSAKAVLRSLRRAPMRVHGHLPTAEEVKLIVSAIRKRGLLDEAQEEMIHSVFDLDRVRVREIMVPWNRVTCLEAGTDLPAALERVVADGHSRIPVYQGAPDQVLGVLYTKDLLALLLASGRAAPSPSLPFSLRAMLHQPLIVPEAMSLAQMLKEVRRRHSQVALVVDEFGTFVGLVTIEDVLEQIVGGLQDDGGQQAAVFRRLGANVLVVDASVNLRDLAGEHGINLPRGAGYETLAGFVLAQLGFIPRGGESFCFGARRYTVVEMEGRRVARIRIESLPGAPPPAPSSPVRAGGGEEAEGDKRDAGKPSTPSS